MIRVKKMMLLLCMGAMSVCPLRAMDFYYWSTRNTELSRNETNTTQPRDRWETAQWLSRQEPRVTDLELTIQALLGIESAARNLPAEKGLPTNKKREIRRDNNIGRLSREIREKIVFFVAGINPFNGKKIKGSRK